MPLIPPSVVPLDYPDSPGLTDIRGTPGVGVVGPNQYRVGVQSPEMSPDSASWAARQPNQDPRVAMEEADRLAREGLYLDHLMLNGRTSAAGKAVEAGLQFQAMRNYERDFETAKAAGLSDSQAMLQAIARNPDAFKGTAMGSTIGALTRPQAVTPTQPGEPTVITDPRTGQPIGLGLPTGPTTRRIIPDPVKLPGKLSDVDHVRISRLNAAEDDLRKNLPATIPKPPGGLFGGNKAKYDSYSAATNSIATIRAERDAILGGSAVPAAPSEPSGEFDSTASARSAGHKAGDVITLKGIGKVRLK